MRNLLVCMALSILFSGFGRAQDLRPLKWQNRVLLLYTDSLVHPQYQKMEEALLKGEKAVGSRKLVVYTIMGQQVSRGLPARTWQDNLPLREAGQNLDKGFGLELIGLDGGVKYRSTSAVPLEELWTLIDGMPMRRAELKNQGKL